MTERDQRGAIGFAEKILELLDEGRYTATYKYAVLLGLMDVCLEHTQRSGAPPDTVTTRQLADKIVELYWPHTVPFGIRTPMTVLKQNTAGQAEIVSAIIGFRERHAADPSVPRWESRLRSPEAYAKLVRLVEWKLIEMPLPRLQTMGHSRGSFIYEINWDEHVQLREVRRYQKEERSNFDNRLMLRPGVGEYFLQLNGLLRPLIQRRWAAMVAQLNGLEESQLEVFLFGADRVATTKVRIGLWEIQNRRCFYCDARIAESSHGDVDHFMPWARYPDDSLDNFVFADRKCNGFKSSSLAAARHLARWARRFEKSSSEHCQLSDLARGAVWERGPDRTLNVARAIYLRLPNDARLWLRGKEFVAPDAKAIQDALTTP